MEPPVAVPSGIKPILAAAFCRNEPHKKQALNPGACLLYQQYVGVPDKAGKEHLKPERQTNAVLSGLEGKFQRRLGALATLVVEAVHTVFVDASVYKTRNRSEVQNRRRTHGNKPCSDQLVA